MRFVVSSEISELPRSARETVVCETPVSFAISLIEIGTISPFAHVCIVMIVYPSRGQMSIVLKEYLQKY
jgi:hypothetical protein